MASTSTWTPPPGRHQVNVGPSLVRSIKNRKRKGSPGVASTSGIPKKSNIPEREFYSFRSNFKPIYLDPSRPASLEIKKGEENTQLWAEYPSKEPNEFATYNGSEATAREVDCILIYDEETGQYTLEKLDSYVSLLYEGKKTVIPSSSAPSTSSTPTVNMAPPTSTSPSNNKKGKKKQEDGDDRFVNPPIPKPPTALSLPSKQSTFSLPPAPASLPKKPTAAPIPPAPPVPIPMTVPPGVSATITMEEVLGDEDDEEEDWEQVPTPGAMPLPPTAVSSSSSPSPSPSQLPEQADYDVQLENEIFGALAAEEEGEEIDVNAFEAELNAEMGLDVDDGDGDEDDDMEDAMMEPVLLTAERQPISLNRLASGMDPMAMDADSDDDFSSSDSDSD